MAHLVEYLTLGFNSGHGLMDRGIDPHMGFRTLNGQSAWGVSLSLPLPKLSHTFVGPLSLSNKWINLQKINKRGKCPTQAAKEIILESKSCNLDF